MSMKNKSIKALIEQDKKEQRELYEGNKSSLGSSVNKEVPEDQNKIQERLNALRESGLSSGNSESGKNSNISNAFSDVLTKKNFTKGMAAGAAGSTFMNNPVTNSLADMKDYVQYQVKKCRYYDK